MLFWLKKFVSMWLMPLPFCLVLLTVGALLLWRTRWLRAGRALVVSGIVLLMAFGNHYVSTWLMRPLERQFPAMPELLGGAPVPAELAACRWVVVLGGGHGDSPALSATNQLSTSGLSRLTEAVRLLQRVPEAKLIVSGGGPEGRPPHAEILARAAESLGIAPERIVRIVLAKDTEDEAYMVRDLVAGQPLALVTSAWHLPRAMALFRGAGMEPLPCPADFRTHTDDAFAWTSLLWDVDSLTRSTFGVRERIGYAWIWLRGKSG